MSKKAVFPTKYAPTKNDQREGERSCKDKGVSEARTSKDLTHAFEDLKV
jgi:hypothetical protein